MRWSRRSIRSAVVLSLAAVPLGSLAGREAPAQATLERLEEKIRKELADEGAKPAVPPVVAQAREPGYVGLVADDQNDRGRGVRILEVKPGSPAEKAGLKPGDLIVGMAGMRLRQMSDMIVILRQVRPGGSVALEVLRDDKTLRMEVTATERPLAAAPAPPAAPPPVTIPAPPVELPKVATPAPAPVDGDRARIEQLERRVADLERQVAELKALLRQPK